MVELRWKGGELQYRQVEKVILDVKGYAWWQKIIQTPVWGEWRTVTG